jgi:[acyl-carrier-protein] S-malonyltransferase
MGIDLSRPIVLPMTNVFMFPGQSSKYPGLLDGVIDFWAPARQLVAHASELLGRDLLKLYRADNDAAFDCNRDVQVGVFLASHLHLSALEAHGVKADYSLGLSLGEYNHLVHIGALDFASALRLVDARGRVYDQGPNGMMAALFPVDLEMVEDLLARAKSFGVVEVANLNSPSQFVVAGETPAVEEVMRLADDELAVAPTPIERQIPMHTSVFRPVTDQLLPHLRAAPWHKPVRQYISNVLGEFVANPSGPEFCDLLGRHVYSPVRWRESIDAVVARFPQAVFVEVGPRGVLYNLLHKRWHTNRKYKTDSAQDFASSFQQVIDALSRPKPAVECASLGGASV